MDEIKKEMDSLRNLNCFKFHPPSKSFKKSDGWQYATLHMIFDINQQYIRHKECLVEGGNVVVSSSYNTKSTTVQNISAILLMLIAI